jgi:hypothetical protein
MLPEAKLKKLIKMLIQKICLCKESLNSDGQQFNKTNNHLSSQIEHKKIYGICHWTSRFHLGQAQKLWCG